VDVAIESLAEREERIRNKNVNAGFVGRLPVVVIFTRKFHSFHKGLWKHGVRYGVFHNADNGTVENKAFFFADFLEQFYVHNILGCGLFRYEYNKLPGSCQ
jgi:hypothetical protein